MQCMYMTDIIIKVCLQLSHTHNEDVHEIVIGRIIIIIVL